MWEIRFATVADTEAIHALWNASFPVDTPEEINAFLAVVNLHEECLLLCEEGRPISMGFFLPAGLRTAPGTLCMRYLYAAATLPDCRNKGAFSKLHQAACSHFAACGEDALFLKPATPSLVAYYQRFGYRPMCSVETLAGTAMPGAVSIRTLTAKEYLERRAALLPPVAVLWDDRFVLAEAAGSQAFAVGDTGVALSRTMNGTLHVTELLGVQDVTVCAALAAHCGVGSYTVRTASLSGECFGMILPLTADRFEIKSPYMGLAFD